VLAGVGVMVPALGVAVGLVVGEGFPVGSGENAKSSAPETIEILKITSTIRIIATNMKPLWGFAVGRSKPPEASLAPRGGQ